MLTRSWRPARLLENPTSSRALDLGPVAPIEVMFGGHMYGGRRYFGDTSPFEVSVPKRA